MKGPKRYIVEVWDDITAEQAFYRCMLVARNGLVSESRGKKHHCGLTAFTDNSAVAVTPNAKSERFQVYQNRRQK